jgi:hypothetical protein
MGSFSKNLLSASQLIDIFLSSSKEIQKKNIHHLCTRRNYKTLLRTGSECNLGQIEMPAK